MRDSTPGLCFCHILLENPPDAVAWVSGSPDYPKLSGLVRFYFTPYDGTLVEAEFFGLPDSQPGSSDFYAMHIHETGDCTPPFSQTGDHYNPASAPHPAHAGDMVPLLGNEGYAWTSFYDRRFLIPDILGRSVIIHRMPDDFTSQPSGNAGEKIGCGIIH